MWGNAEGSKKMEKIRTEEFFKAVQPTYEFMGKRKAKSEIGVILIAMLINLVAIIHNFI